METNFEYLAKILKDDAIDTWTLREQEEINKLNPNPRPTYFLIRYLYRYYIPLPNE